MEYIKSGSCKRTDLIDIKCPKHGWKKQNFFELRNGYGCPSCFFKKISLAEEEIAAYIKNVYSGEIISNDRMVLDGKELDIYIPGKKIAIEYDGLYWHNNVNNYYKYLACKQKGIRLIQITEWEWKNKRKQIEEILKRLFIAPEYRIYARNCDIREISAKEFNIFCDSYHLQGRANSSVCLGLFFKDELLEVEGFSKARFGNYDWELTRECSKENTLVMGGKSKLLTYFEKTQATEPSKLLREK